MTTLTWQRRLRPGALWCTVRLLQEVDGLRVSSGWRSVLANRRARGKWNSAHLLGWATDLVGSRQAMDRAAEVARSWGARQVLIHDAGSGVHLHVDWRGAVAPA